MQMTIEFVTTEHNIRKLGQPWLTYSSESAKHNHCFANVHFFLPRKNCY